ncbi:putative pentatricopeptide repeat-containing protein At5g47460 [Vicia villosa]|uniref:putative pentatricopeptide repeat-containing protein At5g47460 n=1 Tax=Vicia villosa TaxID=3911 RepID=UPI00273AD6A5|nr:putative pentatricopeptide repeat-containing protein At5g47460 [Vicia villosa]
MGDADSLLYNKYGLDSSVVVGTALIDMYSKCGRVNDAESIFNMLSDRNLVSWNAMISGYARNGDFAQVISLFESLKMERDAKPDSITFLNLISACSHSQIPFESAINYYDAMINEYGIAPSIEHCCSMIRLMGQKGELWRAQRMIHELGFESCGVVWRSLLGACETQEDLQVAEVAAAKVIELERDEDYVYVMLSNMYASFGRWEDVNVIRSLMSKKKVRKEAGFSWIEIDSFVPYETT